MATILTNATDRIRSFWSSISMTQRMFIGGLSVVMIAAFIAMVIWLNKTEYGTLYSNLTPEDAARVVKNLDTQKIPYKIEQNGTAITVPAELVHGIRINIAGDKILTGQGVGFEIFDDNQIGKTDFVQKLSYRRALEGELTRTLSELPGVEGARVHLVIPQRSLFIEEQQKPSASVLLKLDGSKKLETKDMEAVVNLVSMSVEGLDRSMISIADTNGKVLFRPEEEKTTMNRTQYEQKMTTQQHLEHRIEEMLMPVIGAGHIIAKVNADLDFSQKTISRELYDPEKTAPISEMRSETSTQGRAAIEGGVPDPNFRGDGPSGTMSDQNSTSENRTTNYVINKEVQNIVDTVGRVDRLSVAVIVDGTYTTGEDGKQVYAPRSDEELQRIRQLVSGAVGFDSARGDIIEVTSMEFSTTDIVAPSDTMAIIADYASRFGKPMLNALLAFLFLILVVRPVVLALIRPKVEGKMIEGLEGLPAPDERLALVDDDDEAVAATATLEKIEDIKAHALHLSEQNIDQALGIIKSWLKDSGPRKGQAALPAAAKAA